MLHLWQALILGVIQGISELFPVSSLAQTILLPALLHWPIDQEGSDFLAFVVALHLATAVALLIFFRADWMTVFQAYLGSLKRGKLVYDENSRFAWLLVAGTLVVGAVGLVLEKKLRHFFDDPSYTWIVAVILIVNGGVMFLGDYLKRQASRQEGVDTADPSAMATPQRKKAHELSFTQGTAVGATQALALLPGISRSGVTIVGGLLAGLSYEEASRFSFMLATPVIGLAALLKVPSLLKPEARHELALTIPSAILAGITAYLSVAFLMRYFKHNRLSPFAYYCILFGGAALILLKLR
jgi:undecaprenyl-diphosphatase